MLFRISFYYSIVDHSLNAPLSLKAPSEKDLNTLTSCLSLAQENQHIIVAVCPGKKVDMRKKAAQLFKKQGEVIEHKSLNQWEQDKLFGFMSTYCQNKGASISTDAMVALESCSGNSLSVLSQCLDTLLTYIQPETSISDSAVKALYHGEESSLFQLGEAIKKAKVQSLNQCLKALLKSNEPPVRILATLHNQFKLYYQLRLLESKNESEASMAKILKKTPIFLKTLRRELSRTYTLSTLKKCLYLVRDADLNLKTGRQVADTAVHYCVMAISTVIK